MKYSVTSTTHEKGDLRKFAHFFDAYAYASELVELGFSPIMTFRGEKFGWSEIASCAEIAGLR
jgi:hypothetical protein